MWKKDKNTKNKLYLIKQFPIFKLLSDNFHIWVAIKIENLLYLFFLSLVRLFTGIEPGPTLPNVTNSTINKNTIL